MPEQFDDAVGFLAGVKDCPRAAVNPPEDQEEKLTEALEGAAKKEETDPESLKQPDVQLMKQAAQKEMVFLCGFDMHMLNRFLAAVKKGKLQKVELKAMLTPANRQWSGRHLLREIAAEHIYMKQYGKSVHK